MGIHSANCLRGRDKRQQRETLGIHDDRAKHRPRPKTIQDLRMVEGPTRSESQETGAGVGVGVSDSKSPFPSPPLVAR